MVNKIKPYREISKDGEIVLNLHSGQTQVEDSVARFIFMLGSPQVGKALPIETLISTPFGFRTMGELEVGDKVYDPDGRVCTVEFTTGVMWGHRCYEITFDNGYKIITDAEHLWTTQDRKQRRHWGNSVLTTLGIKETLVCKDGRLNHSIATSKAIEYPERLLPIPPYTLGVWLGDGLNRGATIFSADEPVVQGIIKEGVLVGAGRQQNGDNKSLAYCIGKEKRGGNDKVNHVLSSLRQMGLLFNKHIPEIYLTANIEQRLSLLHGLMDTDGYCSKDGKIEFSASNQKLTDGVVCLLASLGIKPHVHSRFPVYNGKKYKLSYRVTFVSEFPVFSLKRKLERQKLSRRIDTKRLFIKSIKSVHSMPVKCIQVDSTSSMYLASDKYIPTHNTCYGPHWLEREIRRCGSGDYLAVTATYDLFKLKMLPELLKTFEGGEAEDKKGNKFSYKVDIGRYWAGLRLIELSEDLKPGKFWAKQENDPMWGRIILRSAEAKGGLVSTTGKAAWIDEPGTREFTREAWDNTRDRVALARGRILGTATIYVVNWMKSEIYVPWKRGDKSIDVIQVDAICNPAFPIEEYQAAKDTLPAWKFEMKYRGIYQNPAGMIYDSFNEETHKIKRFPIPDNWPIYSGHDFGAANPAALFVAQVKLPLPDGAPSYLRYDDLVYFYEYLPGAGRSVQEHVDYFKRITDGYKVMLRAGGNHQEDEIRQAYGSYGWNIREPKITSVEAGIASVYALHKQGKIFVFSDLEHYLDEKLSYSRELDEQYQPTDIIANKQRYHIMDAERYILSDFRGVQDRVKVSSY